jgi:hypothetical protein
MNMAKKSTRTPPRSQANYTSTAARQSLTVPDRPPDASAVGDSADRAALVQDDAEELTRAVSMASEPPELSTSAPDEEQIRDRAYQRFLDRGGSHGDDVNDWIEAETELRNRR